MTKLLIVLAFLLATPASAETNSSELPDAPTATKRVPPRMPEWAVDYEQPGEAVVRVVIDESGQPVETTILSEFPRNKKFGKAAVDSVERWQFKSGLPGTFKLTVKFQIKNVPRLQPRDGQSFDGNVPVAPEPIDRERPVYPLMAQQMPLEGTVQILAAIEDGKVVNGGIVENGYISDVFGDCAFNAVRKWRFAETLNGPFLINVPFTLDGLKAGLFSEAPRSYRP